MLIAVIILLVIISNRLRAGSFITESNTGKINETKTLMLNSDAEKPLPTGAEIKDTLLKISKQYGPTIARYVELIYRAETTSKYKNDGKWKPFNSLQFRRTYSPGMLKMGSKFPYGWSTIADALWKTNPQYAPNGETTMVVGNKNYTYLSFPTFEGAAFSLAAYLNKYKNPLRWNSTDKGEQEKYGKLLAGIKPAYWNELFKDVV